MSQYIDEWDIFAEEESEKHREQKARVYEYLTSVYENTPLVAIIYMDRTMKLYGSFSNGLEAYAWYEKQPFGVHFIWHAIRTPHIKRNSNDFYLPERHENSEREFDHTIKEQ